MCASFGTPACPLARADVHAAETNQRGLAHPCSFRLPEVRKVYKAATVERNAEMPPLSAAARAPN
jgi:hypothetical protein